MNQLVPTNRDSYTINEILTCNLLFIINIIANEIINANGSTHYFFFILWSKHFEKQNWNGISLPFTGLIIIEHKSLSSNLTPNASTAAIHDESPSKVSEKMSASTLFKNSKQARTRSARLSLFSFATLK
jgi:hypothetical protein